MSDRPVIRIRRLNPATDADIPLPRYMTAHAAGMDLHAALETDLTLPPGEIALIPTGFAVAIPEDFEGQIRPRSGLAIRHGIGLINAPGTIDADYRGEIRVAVINLGRKPYTFRRGQRIAQMVIQQVCRATFAEVEQLPPTDRGEGGFGHTGDT